MLTEFRAVISEINFGLCITITPSISQDAFAVNYAWTNFKKVYRKL